jgi:hypothetical protein
MMFDDVFVHGGMEIITKGFPACDPTAYLARRDLEERRIHVMDLGTDSRQFAFQLFQIFLLAGTMHHTNPVTGLEQFLRTVPFGQVAQ